VQPFRLPLVLLFAFALGGCASLGGSVPGEEKVYIGDISKLPQVVLPGARMQDARAVAMAAARTKGWEITTADANRLLLERPLPPDLPQAQALGSALAPPRMQVETGIVERGDGAIVALQAFVLTNPGTPDEKRIEYTSEYENQLLISLSSLSSAWIAARDKVRADVPVLAEFEGEADTETSAGGNLGDVATTVTADGVDATGGSATAQAADATAAADVASEASEPWRAPSRATVPATTTPATTIQAAATPAPRPARPTPQRTAAVTTAQTNTTAGAPTAASGVVAPTIEAPRSPTTAAEAAASPPPAAPITPAGSAGDNSMLVLNQGTRKGLWAYYAEDFARLRGCALGERGATLIQETGGFEVHEVQCVGSNNLLVKCRGGVCEPMR
jgi:hypothetical protein